MPLVSLFRQEAIDHRTAREPIDRVAQVTVPYDWWVLVLLAVACLFVVLWAVFVKIELTLPVDVVVIKPTDDRVVVSPVTARVSDVLVDEGTPVAAGDALVRVVVPDLHRRLAEAKERERAILEEIGDSDSYDKDLGRMLIDSRAEAAALTKSIEREEIILSPYSGKIFGVGVSIGHVAMVGQEIVLIRVGESTDTFAITFVPPASVERVLSNTDVMLRCPSPQGIETLSARAIGNLPQNMIDSDFLIDAGFDLDDHQISLMLSKSATVSNGTRCEAHIPLKPQTPLQILLSAR